MKCTKCRFENPEEAKFCIECGRPIEFQCLNCGAATPRDGKFCMACGHKLDLPPKEGPKSLSTEEKIEKIQKYLPKGIAEKILAQRDRIEGERKQVTVMFCDMEGYTGLTEKIDPEEAYSIMDQVYEILIHKVRDYEGTVNEMTGDGVMALFGAPIALEDAPQRAIRSALAIHREMTRFNDRMKQENNGIPPLKMRIGIHTGPVVVGTLGNDLRVEFKAVGDTVNLASRMESMAEPGTTFVSEDTFRLTEGFFRFENLGARQIKGKETPIKVFRVIAPSTRRTRFEVSAEGGLTPFVGRERELEIMLDCLDRARMDRGQAISIVAEAGIGKSRLLYEFRKAIANEDVTFLEGRCLSYSRNVPFHPVIDLLKSNFNIQQDDNDFDIKAKVKEGLGVLGVDEGSTLPYLLEVLSVKDSGIDQIMISPEARKDRISGALKQIVLKGAALRPLVIAIEDLYWVDNSSVDVFKDLLDNIGGSRVFLIFTYRPTFVHTWGAKSYHSQITLNRLSNRETLSMAASLLSTDNIRSDLEELILEKTEGVPFYIEEFIRTLKDLQIICQIDDQYALVKDVREIAIPSTIQDVIMARVDGLPEGAKEVLQAGSAIEREFSYDMIQKVTGFQENELLSCTSVLKDAELIFERGIYPDTSFIFRHALTRDVVYDSLLAKRKKKLHEEIGPAIEESYKERLSEYYEVLIEHFVRSGNYEKGADYSKLAEKKAEKAGSLNDAILYAKKRVSCLEQLPVDGEVEKKIVGARTVLGLYYTQLALSVEAKKAVDPIIDLAVERDYKRRVSQINTIIGQYYAANENYPKARKHFEKALETGEELNDILTLVLANNFTGICLSENGEFEEAIPYFEKALEINVMANVPWGIAAIKANLASWAYGRMGKFGLAYQTSYDALQIADESGDIFSKAHANYAHGVSCMGKGYIEESEKYFLKAVDLSQKNNQLAFIAAGNIFLGWICTDKGKYETSQNRFETAISLGQQYDFLPSYLFLSNINIVLAKVMNKVKEINLNEVFRWYEDIQNRWAKGLALNCVGKILLNIDDQHLSEAEDWINSAIETNKKYGMRWNLAQDHALYAELYKRKTDLSKAKEKLYTAIEIFKECGSDGWVERYEKELASLS
jgi:class 3 adenylate cyclase/tetratricopeptide (TPR) repeat protein